ncbi:MAG TPA: DUF3418 domain-containing protein, partial [Corynebacterium sp.]|nr:DUF3418 domain-containing protein [Corynebacterium sp.]
QLDFMLPKNAVTTHGMDHLRHLPRYLSAMQIRLEEMGLDPDKDADRQDEVAAVKATLRARLTQLPQERARSKAVRDIAWLIQEFRVSLFAQRLGTARPASARRIEKAIAQL